jgi:hypothetical protein
MLHEANDVFGAPERQTVYGAFAHFSDEIL